MCSTKVIRAVLLTLVLAQWNAGFAIVTAESHISIRIITPGDRRNIPTGESPVTIEIRGAEAIPNYYWELYADQLPTATIRNGSMTATVNFPRTGPHRIQVVLYDAQGNRISSHEILVIAAPVEPRTPIFNREQFVPAMAGMVLVISSIIFFGLWHSRRSRKIVYGESEPENELARAQAESDRGESL